MTEQDDFASLRGSPLTSNLTDEQVRSLVGISYCRMLENDETLIEEGKTDNSLHVLTEGTIAVMRDVGGGEYTTMHLLRTGDMAGEMGFIDGRPHSATLRSVGQSKVCSFDREGFESLLESEPWVVYRVMQNIVAVGHDILRRMNTQFVEMSNYISKAHGRY
ncbi:MAG: cyclic nucleotide-binding domain-containing protein [Chromatiales bacterium]|jgi:CRP-like cAMP-binding protein